MNFRHAPEALIDSGQDLGYDARAASVLRGRKGLRSYGAILNWNMDMPFVDIGKLEVFEKGVGDWRRGLGDFGGQARGHDRRRHSNRRTGRGGNCSTKRSPFSEGTQCRQGNRRRLSATPQFLINSRSPTRQSLRLRGIAPVRAGDAAYGPEGGVCERPEWIDGNSKLRHYPAPAPAAAWAQVDERGKCGYPSLTI